MGIIIPLILIAICCVVIWRAGDGFMTASEYVGRNLSEGVRGATINAIASSMPELFTTLFFLFVKVLLSINPSDIKYDVVLSFGLQLIGLFFACILPPI